MKKILITLIAIALSISAFSQTRARTGLTVGDHKVSGTNIVVQDSTTTDPDGKLTFFIGGSSDTASLHINAADQIDLGTIYVPLYRDTVEVTGDKTLALTDVNKVLVVTKATVVTITVPPYVDVAIPNGGTILFLQGGAGEIKFVAGAGVTLDFELDSVYSNTVNHLSFIRKRATNKWNAGGLTE